MQLIVYFNNCKAKQVINLSDKFALGRDGKGIISDSELNNKARDLAYYIGGQNYLNHQFTIN